MSRLRTANLQCSVWLDDERGQCGDDAVIRCNACKEVFCEECWIEHLEMTVVVEASS